MRTADSIWYGLSRYVPSSGRKGKRMCWSPNNGIFKIIKRLILNYRMINVRITKIKVALTAFLRANGAGFAEQGCSFVSKTLTTFIRNTIRI